MNKGAGLAVVLTVAVAAMRVSTGIGSPASQTASQTISNARPQAGKTSHAASTASTDYAGGCTAYEADPTPVADSKSKIPYPKLQEYGSAKSVIDHFFNLDPTDPNPDLLKNQTGVNFAIALAPDPRHTNLSVMFDRQMVAIQQAAQDEGYTYNSSWLPWASDSRSFPRLADQQLNDDLTSNQEACPGVLLFRKSTSADGSPVSEIPFNQGLVVLVVGEQPTGGINQNQWTNAIYWLVTHSLSRDTLRILGPTFSGSLVSLDRDLKEIGKIKVDKEPPPVFKHTQVLSGSVSSCSSLNWFHHNNPAITFGTFQENDELHIYRLLRYLASQNTLASDTAILSEDETEYGDTTPSPDQTKNQTNTTNEPSCNVDYNPSSRPVRLFYPRDMSALRLEYQKEGVFSVATPAGGHQVHSILQDGAEPAGPPPDASDTIQSYSGPETPLAQEAILYGIVGDLRVHHSRYLILRCSNPLDFLFLTRFFHRAYPEGRIVIVGQDLLFTREVDSTEFRGVLSLTNYPLLPLEQHWSLLLKDQSMRHSHRVFESHIAQGAYLAGRYTFSFDPTEFQPTNPAAPLSFDRKPLLPGYTGPFWLAGQTPSQAVPANHPPTWLTVVGRDGFWPLAVLNDQTTSTLATGSGQPALPLATPSSMVQLTTTTLNYNLDASGKHYNHSLLFSMPFAWKICALCAILLILYQAYGISPLAGRPSTGLFSVLRTNFAPSQQILLGTSCAIALAILFEIASVDIALPTHDFLSNSPWAFWICQLAPSIAIGILIAALLCQQQRKAFFVLIPCLIFMTVIALKLRCALLGNSAATVPLFYRMAHLTSGVSPLLPALFVSTGLYLWTWQAMAGNLLLCKGAPLLPLLSGQKSPAGWRGWFDTLWCKLLDLPQLDDLDGPALGSAHFRMSNALGRRITILASPLSLPLAIAIPVVLVSMASLVLFIKDPPLLSTEGYLFRWGINLSLFVCFLLVLTEAGRLFFTWTELRTLLSALNRMRLRRTLAKLRAVPSSSLWGMSGNVQRVQYQFFAAQLDAAIRLCNLFSNSPHSVPKTPALEKAVDYGKAFAIENADKLKCGPRWDIPIARKPQGPLKVPIRQVFADAVAEILEQKLWPAWRQEQTSLSLETSSAPADQRELNLFDMDLSEDDTIRTAEEFVCFHYIAFIQNILARMRTMVLSMVCLFVAVCFAISFYPFVPRTQISVWLLLNLVVITTAVIYVYANMERNETLSYITNTKPGKLSAEFWLKTAGFLAGPVIGLLTTQFPAIADSVLGWLTPGLDAFKS